MEPSIPRHIGYIVDGNRRWAKSHGLPSYEGHLAGYAALQDTVFDTFDRGVEYVSIYAFSTENWKRGEGETGKLMKLSLRVFKSDLPKLIERRIRVRVIGVTDGLSDALIDAIQASEEATRHFEGRTLVICFNYGGQREIADAAKRCVEDGLAPDEITEEAVAARMYAPDVPACDMVVRTSGEHRLSNFMLWRSSYSELLFLEKYWPDMRASDVTAILEEYARRQRRFGS
jgi:undecaprenyl diphosphate synthase